MSERRCEKCNLVMIKDWEKWLVENENQHWIQCPYCFELEELK